MTDVKTHSSPGGLRGQAAGSTAICTIGKEGAGLTYRGYAIEDLAKNATFEEVAYLLLRGTLPTQRHLDDFKTRLTGLRSLPPALREVLERIPKNSHPMDILRTGASMLGVLEPEEDFTQQDATWRRERSRDAVGFAVQNTGTGSRRRQRNARAEGENHGIRPRRVSAFRSAQCHH
jgi:citrate synthase